MNALGIHFQDNIKHLKCSDTTKCCYRKDSFVTDIAIFDGNADFDDNDDVAMH